MSGAGRRGTIAATVMAILAGCGGPNATDLPADPTPMELRVGLVVVNRAQQPVAPAAGFVIPACGDVFYDVAALEAIAAKQEAWALGGEWPGGDGEGNPLPPVGRLDVLFMPKKGLWFQLVSSTDSPQLFYDRSVAPALSQQAPGTRPKPEAWPPCQGQAKLG